MAYQSRAGHCDVDGCSTPIHRSRMCRPHYRRMARYGTTDAPVREELGCRVDGCDQQRVYRDLCTRHYQRIKRLGRVTLDRPSVEERFFAKIRSTEPFSCWEWIGTIQRGYGVFHGIRRSSGAHRFSWEYFVGPIPEGLEIDHLCRNRACVNPNHLEPVTRQENLRRRPRPVAA